VVDLGRERDLGRLEGVVGGEGEGARDHCQQLIVDKGGTILTGRRHHRSKGSHSVSPSAKPGEATVLVYLRDP
jgi:hypothetical protein